MSGQWIETPQGQWVWDDSAPAGDPSPTLIRNQPVAPSHELGTPRQESAMTSQEPIPSAPHVLDPTLGSDGGGHGAESTMPAQAYTPDSSQPVDSDLVACPTCGTGVHRDRLRG